VRLLLFLNRKTEKPKKTPISVVGDLCFDACFSQLKPKPPSGGQEKTEKPTKERIKGLLARAQWCLASSPYLKTQVWQGGG
jgi:hypothetical protein